LHLHQALKIKSTPLEIKMKYDILIIEDDKINCLIYEQILSDVDVKLDFAYDGEEGLRKFKTSNYQLVLLDLGLPKMDGITVASFIREFEKTESRDQTPIMVITADNSSQTRKLVQALTVNAFLAKPFDLDDFLLIVNSYLNNHFKSSLNK